MRWRKSLKRQIYDSLENAARTYQFRQGYWIAFVAENLLSADMRVERGLLRKDDEGQVPNFAVLGLDPGYGAVNPTRGAAPALSYMQSPFYAAFSFICSKTARPSRP